MNTLIKGGLLAGLASAGLTGVAHASAALSSTGLEITSGNGELTLDVGGRIQFDGYLDDDDSSSKIGSGSSADSSSSFRFRRVWISLEGKVYSFDYDINYDFVSGSLQRAWLSHGLLPHGTLYIGQDKPWASLDELTDNANTPFLERNITSATGVNSEATYTQGLYYAWHDRAFTPDDNLWLGLSVSSPHKQASSADTSTEGTAFNGRIAYAPIVEANRWLHLGVSFINANADTGSTTAGANELIASYVYGNHFDSDEDLTLASYSVSATGAKPHSNTLGTEFAGALGPAFLQAEYDRVAFHQEGEPDDTVAAYSVTAAYALTGETRPYNEGAATYGTITPSHSYGAFELAVRYDHASNDGNDGVFTGLKLAGTNAALATIDEVSMITVGLNYYMNPMVRFVLDYEHGKADLGRAGTDSPNTIGARAQILF